MEFKRQVVAYAVENSNRSAASHYDMEPKRVREWKKDLDKIKETKASRQCLEGRGRKCIDEELEDELVHWIYEQRSKMLHISRKMIMWKAKIMFDEKTTILPLEIRLLLAAGGVKNLCEDMGSLSEEKNDNRSRRPDRSNRFLCNACASTSKAIQFSQF